MAKKNKMKPRELREAQKKARQLKAAEINNNAAPAIAAMPAAEVIAPAAEKKKSSVKAAGMKSILVSENKMYITSFGKGNSAVLEYEVDKVDNNNYNKTQLSSKDNSNIELGDVNEVNITFSSKRGNESGVEINTSNPTHRSGESSPVRWDMLGLKSELEKRFFGKTFDDNIHIQLIYNILDIEKILAVYVTNIVYALNNMLGIKKSESYDDFMGYLSARNTYEVFTHPDKSNLSDKAKGNIKKSFSTFNDLLKTKRLGYFGLEEPKTKDTRVSQAYKKRVYHMLAIVGQIRQSVFHDKSSKLDEDLYSFIDIIDSEYRETLDYLVDERFDSINKGFIQGNKVNISLLIDMMKGYETDDIIRLYYDFIVLKSQKNLGFSIKKLREKMLDEYGFRFKDKQYDSVRSKMYKLMDFLLFCNYYRNDVVAGEALVRKLRFSMTDDEKEGTYADEAEKLWGKFRNDFENIADHMNGDAIKELGKADMDFDEKILDSEKKNASDLLYFSKMIYMLTYFLDGKEINDLLTTLISKFDNIKEFLKIMKSSAVDVECELTAGYKLFNDSQRITNELFIVKNIASMRKPAASAKLTMFRDALTILGIDDNITDDRISEILKLKEKGKGIHGLRNFITNNVIESSRFVYLIKYANAQKIREVAKNEKVVMFVLGGIPDTQIERYYKSCVEFPDMNSSLEAKRSELARMIKNISFDDFKNVKQQAKGRENVAKERAKAVIGLYLTVMYLLVKNLVNVNARYVIAIHCLERDFGLYKEIIPELASKNLKNDYRILSQTLCELCDKSPNLFLKKNERLRKCVEVDIYNADSSMTRKYRNCIAHLTVVRELKEYIGDIRTVDSYFSIYHYVMQRCITKREDDTKQEEKIKYEDDLLKNHGYTKDFVKALNSPFGYNIPRFKNLSIEQLFDRNEYLTEK
ncbi:type VI-D CRISPR-associated RNA-guided ribonuclease Cas13d [Ruminococcus bicirculans (ex Wegman et al. 2014)]|uniref:type VI-D CRISPR-associated RNA-guided ribonuclease Cas13d n=2 Tax=Ruminococcus bicirculans (ex Wegman et al. 2014) TaxID=1160721 RepID=UPI0022E148B7|nr:type VI-D CRISPR-associated RNA-guided ribonuclease Cas13d [Ruminococcus bicirculans (ex Wegman et al. 2014)]